MNDFGHMSKQEGLRDAGGLTGRRRAYGTQ